MKIYRGEDSIKKLMEQMLMKVEYCRKIISTKFKKPLVMREEEERSFRLLRSVIFVDKNKATAMEK